MRDGDDGAAHEAARAGQARDARISAAHRRTRGVVHTPPDVARFVLRRVDAALVGLGRRGIGDPDVALIDPACGPGVFLAAAIDLAPRPPRVALGLDVDAAAVADAEAALRPRATGWDLRLEVRDTLAGPPPIAPSDATLAIVGNPPWAGRSANRDARHTDALLEDFRRLPDGARLAERKIGVLSDDYVRFFRWSAEVARHAAGGAVVALVTNASFLDGAVHRAMRAALLSWFADVDVIDLGGSALIARREGTDENVFGVRPGAAITIATRPAGHVERLAARARYGALRGSRHDKLEALAADRVALEEHAPRAPRFAFCPEPRADVTYASWPSLAALVPFHREGLQTNRDAMCVDADREALLARLARFAEGEGGMPAGADRPSAHYDPERARASTRRALAETVAVRPVAYRPLDTRWVAVVKGLCHRPRPALLAAMDASSFALYTVRKDRGERPWAHFGAGRHAVDNCYASTRSSCRARAFPTHRPDGAPNLAPSVVGSFAAALARPPRPEEVLDYALAVLAAPSYRARYDRSLKIDYPRLPPPPSSEAFDRAVRAGAAVRDALEGAADEDGPEVEIGHHRVRSRALGAAIERADAAVAPLLP